MDGDALIKKAYEAILNSDFEQAIEWFERAIAMNPNNAAFHYKLSITYSRSNKLRKAVEHATQAVRLDPEEDHYIFHLQHLQARQTIRQAEKFFHGSEDQLWMAVALLKQAIMLDSLSWEAFLMLGLAYSRLKEYSQAIQAIRELLRLDPEHEIGRQLLEEYQNHLKQYMQS
ncbi:tetratricopeptide repeat protein [Paenibacillus sp. TAB 01]|uniref:tetratricopeptide repeat protein n=1 Tax=Paenibacillus sp. TAB 01 TaxID=3368988 RepID=UPI003751AE3A